jgi:ADP-dependent NAD(P)H-hydrate dehydratase
MKARRAGGSALLIEPALLRDWPLPKLAPGADKQARGDVLVVGGSREIFGAVLLSATAALRAGAGRVQLASARSVAATLGATFPEARVIGLPEDRSGELTPGGARVLRAELRACKAVLVGPGMRSHAAAKPLLSAFCRARDEQTLVVDAAALRVLGQRSQLFDGCAGGVVLTPHAGEMAELWGCEREQVQARPLELAREAARALGVVLVLKGAETLIVTPEQQAFRNLAGNSGLATAGSGDVLSGLIAGLAARGAEPAQAAVWGVYLHAKAGEALAKKLGPLGYLARELAAEVPRLLECPNR